VRRDRNPAIAGGWQINTLVSVMSGTLFTVTSDAGSLRMPGNDQRADQVKQEVRKLAGSAAVKRTMTGRRSRA
jgi:hypothetical protein